MCSLWVWPTKAGIMSSTPPHSSLSTHCSCTVSIMVLTALTALALYSCLLSSINRSEVKVRVCCHGDTFCRGWTGPLICLERRDSSGCSRGCYECLLGRRSFCPLLPQLCTVETLPASQPYTLG